MPLDHVALRFNQNVEADWEASVYGGVRYLSKPHAQWAVFLDALGLEHAYQPQTFRLDRGVSFAPDFWLPELNAWLVADQADSADRNPDRWKIELFSRTHPDIRVWLSNGVPRADAWHLEQLGATPVRRGMLLADASKPGERVWVCGASDEQASRLVFDAIEIGTGRSVPAPRSCPADPNMNSLMRMAYGQVEHFQTESCSSLGAITRRLTGRELSSGALSM